MGAPNRRLNVGQFGKKLRYSSTSLVRASVVRGPSVVRGFE